VRKYISFIISIILTLYIFIPTEAKAQALEISSLSDATVVSESSENFGNAVSLICSNTQDSSSSFLVRFDLSSIPSGAVIESAQLSLNQTNAEGDTVVMSVYRVSSSWNEATVSGAAKPAVDTSVSYSAMSLNSTNGTKLFSADFSDVVARWTQNPDQNFGFYFDAGSDSSYTYEFGSSESANGPSLSVSYSLADSMPPVIQDISVSSVTESGARITWETNELSTSYVEYGETDQYDMIFGDDGFVLVHTVELTTLKSNTTYHYRVKSADESGNEAVSFDRTFQTLALEQEEDNEEAETTVKPKNDALIEESISPPANLTIKSSREYGENIVTLEWEKSETEGVEAYRVYRSEEDRISYILIGEVGSDITNFTDESVEEGTTYFYVVRAVLDDSESRDSNEEVVTIYGSEIEAEANGMSFWRGFIIFNIVFVPIFGIWYFVFKRKGKKKGKKKKKKRNL